MGDGRHKADLEEGEHQKTKIRLLKVIFTGNKNTHSSLAKAKNKKITTDILKEKFHSL